MREAAIQAKILENLRRDGAFAVKVDAKHYAGTPDVVTSWNGHTFFIETKTIKGELSQIQKYRHNVIQSNGGLVVVPRSWEEVEEYGKWI